MYRPLLISFPSCEVENPLLGDERNSSGGPGGNPPVQKKELSLFHLRQRAAASGHQTGSWVGVAGSVYTITNTTETVHWKSKTSPIGFAGPEQRDYRETWSLRAGLFLRAMGQCHGEVSTRSPLKTLCSGSYMKSSLVMLGSPVDLMSILLLKHLARVLQCQPFLISTSQHHDPKRPNNTASGSLL